MSEEQLREKALMMALAVVEKAFEMHTKTFFEVAEDMYQFLKNGKQPEKATS